MKVVIICAGPGIRMRPVTDKYAKTMIPVNNQPFLAYLLRNLKKAGYTKFGFIVNHKKEQIEEFVKKLKLNASYIIQPTQKGTADALTYAKEFVGRDNFILVSGDNIYSENDFKDIKRDDNLNYIKGINVSNPERYGVLIENNGFLIEIKEKPKKFIGSLINTGLYKLTPEIFEAIKKIEFSERGELELTDALNILAKENKVKVLKIQDYWKDLGKPEDIPKMEEFLSSIGE